MREFLIQNKHPVINESAIDGISEILRTGKLSGFKGSSQGMAGGRYVQELEQAFCNYLGVKHSIAVQSATAGLHISLLSLGIKQGDEVIVSPYTFSSSASCVLMVGAKPVFCDIEDRTFGIDPTKLESLITKRTKAIIPVHLHGHPACMNEIMEVANKYNIYVIEDAAQAIGATYHNQFVGTIGNCGVFSFNQSKQISTGEGGMIITDNDDMAYRLRALRNHAEVSAPELRMVGFNYRLCEVEAYLALEQLKQLNYMLKVRRVLTNILSDYLSKLEGFNPPVTEADCTHSFYTYAIKYDSNKVSISREEFQKRMLDRGVYFGGNYVTPLYLYPVYKKFGYGEGLCPVAERMWRKEIIVTDIFRFPMVVQDVYGIIKIIGDAISGRNK